MYKFFGFLFLSSVVFAVEKMTPSQANDQVKTGSAVLFDVREADELKAEGKAAPALWLPKSSVDTKDESFHKTLKDLSKSKLVIMYCRSGKRAQVVAEEFEKLGFKTANMGGFDGWKAAGLPVSKP